MSFYQMEIQIIQIHVVKSILLYPCFMFLPY